jgi:hypothetical protein
MSRFQSTIATTSALLTIGVTVATIYTHVENKKKQEFANQQKIQQLEQKLNEKEPVVVAEPPATAPVVAPEPTIPSAPVLPPSNSPAPPVVPPAVPTAPTLPNGEIK